MAYQLLQYNNCHTSKKYNEQIHNTLQDFQAIGFCVVYKKREEKKNQQQCGIYPANDAQENHKRDMVSNQNRPTIIIPIF